MQEPPCRLVAEVPNHTLNKPLHVVDDARAWGVVQVGRQHHTGRLLALLVKHTQAAYRPAEDV